MACNLNSEISNSFYLMRIENEHTWEPNKDQDNYREYSSDKLQRRGFYDTLNQPSIEKEIKQDVTNKNENKH